MADMRNIPLFQLEDVLQGICCYHLCVQLLLTKLLPVACCQILGFQSCDDAIS